jgi:hypothetical protein
MRFRPIRALAIAGAAAAAIGGLALAAPAASAANLPLPTCSTTDPGTAPNFVNAGHCWYLPSGTTMTGEAAGYLAADDGHTRYRFIQVNFPVSAQLPNLNGTALNGAAGVEECDPNIGYAAQFGVVKDPATGLETPFYAQGYWSGLTGDPCINHEPLVPNPSSVTCPVNGAGSVTGTSPNVFCGSFAPVAIGDQLDNFAIYYTPSGSHVHQVSFGFCDTTAGDCRQAYGKHSVNLNFWELGVGLFSGKQFVGAPPTLPVVTFTQATMNCYSCKSAFRPISVIQPVNGNGTGGLENVVDVNSSGQQVLGANNSLDTNGDFTMYNGSTS